ncbi:uncharacterized protein CTRU02_201131 [Colletotrichum truncatum]|uniref:Uncharacterized protein n=1 Tax=Colletotrichum truncatum TaxID=5467 RepID=A0ACC3ZGV0_COLTU
MQLSTKTIVFAAAIYWASAVSAACNFYDGGCPPNTCFFRATDVQVVCCDNGEC